MKQRYDDCSYRMCFAATARLLDHKWSRNDVRTFIEEWTGYSRYELCETELANGGVTTELKSKILNELAMSAQDMVDGIMHGIDPEFNPVSLRPRRESASGKVRDVAYLDLRHQQLGHILKLGLEKHFNARIETVQHASIPNRGQTGLTRQVKRFLSKKLGIKYYQKTDCTAAYASTMYDSVIKIIRAELPSAKWIIKGLEVMKNYAPGGHLIIGGYLDAWLFNYVMSYAIRYVMSLHKSRRGNKIPLVIRVNTYMDDMVLFGKSKSSMTQAIKELIAWLWATFHIEMRTTTGIIELESVDVEKGRKHENSKASRQCPMVDMGGYKISRTHITLRRRNVKKIARCFDRAWREYKETGTLKRQRACAVISRNGMLQNSDSYTFCHKHHVYELLRIAKRIQRYWSKIQNLERMERIRYVVEKHRKQHASICGAT